MSAFLAAAHLDTFELAASLPTRLGLFREPGNGTLVCPVRQLRGEKWVRSPHAAGAKWPELTATLQRISRLGEGMGGIEFGTIDLELLPAGYCMDWRIDRREETLQYEHAILVLRTSPAVTFFAGAEAAAPGIGFLTMVSRRLPRSAINLGADAAIWLAVDFRRHQETSE